MTLANAAKSGCLETVAWLVENVAELDKSSALLSAANAGQIEIFRWLWHRYPDQHLLLTDFAMACKLGHFFIVDFIIKNKPPMLEMNLDAMIEKALLADHIFLASHILSCTQAKLSPDMMLGIATNINANSLVSGARWLHSKLSENQATNTTYPHRVLEEACQRNCKSFI
eukprot:jgi/Hompol1/4434/HPOL_007109-RA